MATVHRPYNECPADQLLPIPSGYCRNGQGFYVHHDSLNPLIQLMTAAKANGVEIVVISAFRSIDTQANLFRDAERRYGVGHGSRWVAPPGHSEHHTGFCVDLADRRFPEFDDEPGFESTPASTWLNRHAPALGFEMSFPPNNWQGIGYEPWHWRYVGCEVSAAIFYPQKFGNK